MKTAETQKNDEFLKKTLLLWKTRKSGRKREKCEKVPLFDPPGPPLDPPPEKF